MKHLQSILLLILLALAGGHTVSFGQTALASAGGESGAQANASATISDAERQNQVQLNHAFAHEFVLTYDHIPDHLEYTNDNYNKPVAERTIDNEDITPLTWKWVKLEMPEPGGSVMTACLRRPQWWLTAHQADVPGIWVAISLPEMGIHGKAQVKELAPSYVDTRFADFQTDDGQKCRPITGWFERRAPEVWQYVFTSGDTIGATPNHPFYSEDRHTYLPADALHTGERVKLASRQTAALLSKWKLETSSEVVYNLEVWRDHNFYVGEHGVLVHNNYISSQSLIDGIHNATKAFHKPYKCEEYSKALRTYFNNNGENIKTKRLQLIQNGKDQSFVIGFDMPDGTSINITTNGFLEFTIINDKIFDNNIVDGMPIAEFLKRIVIPPGYNTREIDISN